MSASFEKYTRGDHYTELSVGEILRRARKYYGKTIEEISQKLRIRVTQLKALEEGKLDQLPGEVYVLGFIRSYSEYLGLDTEKMVKLYRLQYGEYASRPELSFPAPVMEKKSPDRIVIIISVLAAIGIIYIWQRANTEERLFTEYVHPVSSYFENVASLGHNNEGQLNQSDNTDVSIPGNFASALNKNNNLQLNALPSPAGFSLNDNAISPEDFSLETNTLDILYGTEMALDGRSDFKNGKILDAPASANENENPAYENAELFEDVFNENSARQLFMNNRENVKETGLDEAGADQEDKSDQNTEDDNLAANTQKLKKLLSEKAFQKKPDSIANNAGRTGTGNRSARIEGHEGIIIRSTSSSWVEIKDSGGNEVFARVLRPGDRYLVPADDNLYLSTGNAGGLEIFQNNERLGILGSRGEILRGVELEKNNLVTLMKWQ